MMTFRLLQDRDVPTAASRRPLGEKRYCPRERVIVGVTTEETLCRPVPQTHSSRGGSGCDLGPPLEKTLQS